MDTYERSKIADVIQERDFETKDQVLKEGDDGSVFYLIIQGEAYATKLIEGQQKEVRQYKAGDFFGELALLKNAPRAASIFAKSNLKLASIDRDSFKRLLGPLDNILKRNISSY